MTQNDEMKFQINWEVTREQFYQQIADMIEQFRKNGKVIPLPLPDDIAAGTVLLAALNCDHCHLCCTSIIDANLMQTEIRDLQVKYGKDGFTKDGLTFPCRFISPTGCSIYEERPMVCMTFPLQGSASSNLGKVLAVDSACPQAREIALRIYIFAWDLSNKRKQVKDEAENIMKGGGKRKK